MTGLEKVTFNTGDCFNRGGHMGRFDCIILFSHVLHIFREVNEMMLMSVLYYINMLS